MRSNLSPPASGWSNRVLILAIAGILFLTLYPFRFDFSRHLARPLFPFSLGGVGKGSGRFDDFLNVLLFMPFGFGIADKLRERGVSRVRYVALTLAAGALLSYAIELLQIFISERDSGWQDVVTNSFGALIGAILLGWCGGTVHQLLSTAERGVEGWLSLRRTVLVLLVYFACWCALAVALQKEISLDNWKPDSLFVIGNTVENRFSPAWRGRILALEMWDHALPTESAMRLTSQVQPDLADSGPLVAYNFSGSAPYQDERYLLPDLSWVQGAPILVSPTGAFFNGSSWLTSRGDVSTLVSKIKKTRQFSLRISCEPVDLNQMDARIFSISSSRTTNLELRQRNDSLVLWFRTPLSLDGGRLPWIIPKTFVANETRNILWSFDGTDANLFIDGKKHSGSYEMGPGVVLAKFIRHVKAQELEGYQYVFYSIVFFPAGCLIGLASRRVILGWFASGSTVLFGMMLPSLILEAVLVHLGGRALSFANIVLSIVLAACGGFWINAERMSQTRPEVSTR